MIRKSRFVIILALALILPATMMMLLSMSAVVRNAAPSRPEGPCDIHTTAGTPCVTAHSSTRALYSSYNGPLYQVIRQSDGKTLDIGVVQPGEGNPGGYANAAAQDAFCTNTLCLITTLYDQSGNGNHLIQAPPGTFRGPAKGGFNTLPIADMAPITIMGHKAYGVYIIPGMGLRNNNAKGLAINDEPQSIYMVCDGKHFDSGCCFNYGNTSTNSRAVGRGTMETVYFGTATAWGSGNGPGPWIMSDMEAGLFSGYNPKQNIADPTIDSWRFVTGVVNGGGGNQWEIRGGNAQKDGLTTFYSGPRPGSRENNYYYPMHRKGAVQLGNGGDNGNGSAGTFYEGVMTKGYPTDATHNAVQANIVAARYDVQRLRLSRITTFAPGSSQDFTETFTNTTGAPVKDVIMEISVPKGWKSVVLGSNETSKKFIDPVMPGASMTATFKVNSPASTGAGFLTGRVEWKNQGKELVQFETSSQRVRNVLPVKINEVRFETGNNPTDQFIELFNAGNSDVDISNWILINTRSEWAPVRLGAMPAGTKLSAHGFYLLGLSGSGLVAPANRGEKVINVRSTYGFETGQKINIEGETRTIVKVGTAAAPMTTIFVPVSAGPWLTIPAGSTNLPVTNAEGFEVGQKIGIDLGGNFEVATITAVEKAASQTTEGTGISFYPATRFVHKSGDAVQSFGTGITLENALDKSHAVGAPVTSLLATSKGYQGSVSPNQWYGAPLSTTSGSVALMDATGMVVIDAIVYGSKQSNSSANGTITSPEIATLEGDQSQGGCIIVVPGSLSGFGQFVPAVGKTNRSVGRFPDGSDSDNNCSDFTLQNTITLLTSATAGSDNIKVASMAEFSVGQEIIIGTGANSETAVIANIGTPGGTTLSTASSTGVTTSISLAKPLTQVHDTGTQVADNLPTPGAPNKYYRKPGK